jgi:hypothetical protein
MNGGNQVLNSTANLVSQGPSQLGVGPPQGNLRAKWTRAISGTEVPGSPTSNSYRLSKNNNVS